MRKPRRPRNHPGVVLAVTLPLLSLAGSAAAQPVEFSEQQPGGDGDQVADTGTIDVRDVVLLGAGRTQNIQQAPMIVTVITREQIRLGGFRTVEEILRTIPGFELAEREGHRLTSIIDRGQVHSYLYLLNGVPNYELPFNAPWDFERFFDVQLIDRIEVVSGPGGVLWGANAFLGVVNIMTRTPPREGSYHEVTVGGGSGPGEQNTLRAFALSGGRLGPVRYNFMASYLQTDGPIYDIRDSTFTNPSPIAYDQNLTIFGNSGLTTPLSTQRYVSGTLTAEAGDFTLFAHVPWGVRYNQLGPGGSILAAQNDIITEDSEMEDRRFDPHFALRYRRPLVGDRLSLVATGMFAIHTQEYVPFRIWAAAQSIPEVPPSGVSGDLKYYYRRLGLSLELDAQLPAQNFLQYGVELSNDSGKTVSQQYVPVPTDGSYLVGGPLSHTTFTAFAQDEWRIVAPLSLNGGVRYTAHSEFGPVMTASAATVWNVTERVFLRGEYHEGFRPPGAEPCCGVKVPQDAVTFAGNPDLVPESSRAYQAELNFVALEDVGPIKRLYLRTDYSYSELTNLVTFFYGYSVNLGDRRIHAGELLARLELRNQSSFTLGYSYLSSFDTVIGDVRYAANHILNASGTFRLLPWLDLSAVFTAIGPREDLNRGPDQARNQATMNSIYVERLEPDYLLRVGFLVRPPVEILRGLELRVFADNIIDSETFYPNQDGTYLGNDKIFTSTMPMPRWSVFADLTYHIGEESR